ncbi:MAG TPA: hypothetical protein VES67_11845 [Vicinamibacterales bacterium]|nr:hypothetical protein [Vicinamibacterales bacterium]
MQHRQVSLGALAFVCALFLAATEARAQWYVAAYLGGSHTHAATISIDRPDDDVSLQFHDVRFEERSLKSPQYYGLRFGRTFGVEQRFAVEIEWIHAKAYSQTDRQYEVTGNAGAFSGLIQPPAPMNALVSQYAMSHGLNFLLVNLGVRAPVRDTPVTLVARAGAGPMLPHAESTFAGETREQYEYAGLGLHAAAGIDLRLYRGLSALVEYKCTFGRPEITIVGGTGRMTAVTQHLAVGFAFGTTR